MGTTLPPAGPSAVAKHAPVGSHATLPKSPTPGTTSAGPATPDAIGTTTPSLQTGRHDVGAVQATDRTSLVSGTSCGGPSTPPSSVMIAASPLLEPNATHE